MRLAFRIMLFCLFFVPLEALAGVASACGPSEVKFKVNLDSKDHPVAQPEPEEALVYIIHDAGTIGFASGGLGYPTVKIAIDGAWVGATHGNSWFSVPVASGEHHLCAVLQSSLVENRLELAHFTGEPGKVYYFRSRLIMSRSVELLELSPVDSDQGQLLVDYYPKSVSEPKK